ncbi:Mu transposase C-terminal domain-containing protein [Aquipseudomonas alcaligenes]|uniref:Putative transposase n=1 Tax=Aquipseudomonas alcaligenes TaxID=43263 RepID=A0A1N6NNE8_AQUAC|nr:DDE-type integrase/transposase/recombinase [Pseudomonas alcaligenes]SIP93625.1 putative transposase [Pseudomonas alcaligenes]
MSTSTIHVGPGAILTIEEQHVCVLRFVSTTAVEVSVVETGKKRTVLIADISRSMGKRAVISTVELSEVDPDAWEEAAHKFHWLEPLMFRRRSVAEVRAVAEELLASQPTVYRWLNKLEESRNIRCLLRRRRGDAGTKRLSTEVEAVIKQVIKDKYLKAEKPGPTAVYRELKDKCRTLGLQSPAKGTFLNRLNEIRPVERELARNGENAALKYRVNGGSLPGVNGLYSLWQIDHTWVDVELVDSVDRVAIGRPWITVVIDTFSRMVVGWYISFDPPGTIATGLAITNAILPKDKWMRDLGVNYDWPCQGKPRVIHSDNAKEFQGQALEAASQEHGFKARFRKKKKPQYGAYIERYLGTLNTRIHEISGTTFQNVGAKAEYDSAGNAVLTLENFEKWLAHLILGEYHVEIHSGLKGKSADLKSPYAEEPRTPLQRFYEGLFGTDDFPGAGVLPISGNPEQLYLDFLPIVIRTIQNYGVRWECIDYYGPILERWIGSKSKTNSKEGREFIFRYDPRNISTLYFWDPDLKQYFEIGYRNMSRPPISFWELKAIRRFIDNRGTAEVDEDTIFRSREERRAIVHNETNLTRGAARERERERAHRKVGAKKSAGPAQATLQETLAGESKTPSKGPNRASLGKIDLQNLPDFEEFEEA